MMDEHNIIPEEDQKLATRLLNAYRQGTLVQLPFRTKGIVHIVDDLYDVAIAGNTVKSKGVLFEITPEENEAFEEAMKLACGEIDPPEENQ